MNIYKITVDSDLVYFSNGKTIKEAIDSFFEWAKEERIKTDVKSVELLEGKAVMYEYV